MCSVDKICACEIATEQDSSSHWSLLYLDLRNNIALHLDSHNNFNVNAAKTVHLDIMRLLKRECMPGVISIQCLQQNNGYDCGVFTIFHAEFIASKITEILTSANPQEIIEAGLPEWNKSRLANFRSELRDEIRSLACKT